MAEKVEVYNKAIIIQNKILILNGVVFCMIW